MRAVLLALALVLPAVPAVAVSPAPLALGGDAPEDAVARAPLAWDVSVSSDAPWTSGRVALTADAGAVVVPDIVVLGPSRPTATVEVRWTPEAPGERAVRLVAVAEDGGEAAAVFTFDVRPATLALDLAAGAPAGWRIPLAAAARVVDAPTGAADLALDASYTAPEGWEATWSEPWGRVDVDGEAAVEGAFLARFGAGTYALVLRATHGTAEGASEPLLLELDAPGPVEDGTRVLWDGARAPPRIRLTSDSVNADGKLKAPGEEIITRFVVEHDDALPPSVRIDVRSPSGRLVHREDLALPEGKKATLEHRFARSPLAAVEYVLTISADGASAERTFVMKEVKPVLLAADVEPAAPRAGLPLAVTFLVGDRNLDEEGAGPGNLTAKLYRASTALDWPLAHGDASGNGTVAVDLADADASDPTWRVVDGFGAVEAVVEVRPPASAPPAAYRLVLLRDADRLGEASFSLEPPPRIFAVVVAEARPGGDLVVRGSAEGVERVQLAVEGAVAGSAEAAVVAGAFEARIPLPRGLAAGAPLDVRLSGDGAEAAVAALVENVAPDVALVVRLDDVASPPRVLPGARLGVAVQADDANDDPFDVLVRLVDASGAPVAEADGDALEVPRALPRGLYAVEALARDALGATGRARANVTVGAWVEAGFADATVAARGAGDAVVAAARVVNSGNVAVTTVVVRVGDLEGPSLVPADGGVVRLLLPSGSAVEAPVVDGRARLDVDWPPGAATLEVRWPRPADAGAGAYVADLVLVVRGEAG